MKKIFLSFLLSLFVVGSLHASCTSGWKMFDQLKFGDIIFQTSNSGQSKAIQIATESKYSHVGMVFSTTSGVEILEAVQPVKLTPIKAWIQRGDDDHYVVKRLVSADSILTTEKIEEMRKFSNKLIGKDYDIHFDWSDDKFYCSELVWKVYNRVLGISLGELQKLSEFNLEHPIVRAKLEERYGDDIPLDEKVISPAAIFGSDLLITVMQG